MTRRLGLVLVVCLLAVLLSCAVRLLADSPPKLTDVQRAQLTIAILTRDNAQLRLDALVKELTVPGYDLTTTGEYVKKLDPAGAP